MLRSAGDGLPTLGLPMLAGVSGEAVDSAVLSFLTAQALEAKRKEDEETVEPVHVPEWLQLSNPRRTTHFWNRRSGTTAWNRPDGIRVEWVGEKGVPVAMTSLLFLQGHGCRGWVLGIPSLHLGCHTAGNLDIISSASVVAG